MAVAILQLLQPMRDTIVPEHYFKAAGEVLFLGLSLAWIVTYVTNPDIIAHNPLKVMQRQTYPVLDE